MPTPRPKGIAISAMTARVFFALMAAGTAPTGFAQLAYQDVKSLIDENCVVCHSASGPVDVLPFESLEQIRGNQDRMTAAIQEGRMPMGNPDFAQSAEGRRLLAWLKDGSDLRPQPGPPPLIMRDPRTLTFADLEPIVRSRCQICHAGNGQARNLPLTSLAQIRRKAKKAWEALDEGEMPPNDPNFAFSVDGRVLSGWLRYGRDVRWRDDSNDNRQGNRGRR